MKEEYESPVIISKGEEENNDPDASINGLVFVLVAAAVSVAVGASVVGVYSAAIVAYAGLVTAKGC